MTAAPEIVGTAGLPRRDPASRARLAEVAGARAPVSFAHEQVLPVAGGLGALLPGGGLRRGSVLHVGGAVGSTALVAPLLAAATAVGEWAAVVLPDDTFGALAAAEADVALERCAVVRRVPADRWALVVGALLEGFTVVSAVVPPHVRPGDARRLVARARERRAVLIAWRGAWPAEAAVRIEAGASRWHGLERGDGLLDERELSVVIESKGIRRTSRLGVQLGSVVVAPAARETIASVPAVPAALAG